MEGKTGARVICGSTERERKKKRQGSFMNTRRRERQTIRKDYKGICGQQVFLKSAESQRKNKTAKRRSKFSQGTRYLLLTSYGLNIEKFCNQESPIPLTKSAKK